MATSSNPSGSEQPTVEQNVDPRNVVVSILEHNRNPNVWAHYDLCQMLDGTKKARCKLCKKFFAPEGNTTLKNHIQKSCKALQQRVDPTQAHITPQGGVFIYDNESLRQSFAEFVIQRALPFDHFDDPAFTAIIQSKMQPLYAPVSRTTLRRDALKMWHDAKRKMILGFFEHHYGVSLTCDVWSSGYHTGNSYLAVTAHWVNQETWLMMKRTIAFELFVGTHSGNNLFNLLKNVITVYKLENKVFSMSFDNASNNTNAVPRLKLLLNPILDGAFFHTRCVAHIINLSVQAGLEIIDPIRVEFKNMIKEVLCNNNKRINDYKKYCRSVNKKCFGPNLDCPTRWNSTWMMMKTALRQRETLQLFHNRLYDRGLVDYPYTDSSWDVIDKITDMLGVFKSATTYLCGVYYPTSPLVLYQLYLMANKLNAFEYVNATFEAVATAMREKLLKYFKELPPLFSCAAALNPMLNVGGVETLIEQISFAFNLTQSDPDFVKNQQEYFKKCFREMFDIYLHKYGSSNVIHDQMRRHAESSSSRSTTDDRLSLFNTIVNEQSKRSRTNHPTSELGNYMATNFLAHADFEEFEKLDLLAWWKEKEGQYPILAAMARDLLTVQASTVASESAFSVSGRVISQRRSRLTPESVECCICLKDYLDGVARRQNETTLEDAIDADLETSLNNEEIELGMSSPNEDDASEELTEYE